MPDIGALPLVLALSGTALALGMSALTASAFTFWASRAGKLRAYEHTMNDALANALRRLETVEQSNLAARTAVEGIADEAGELLKRSTKERQRSVKANWDADHRDQAQPDMANLSRPEQLRLVRANFERGR